MRELSMQQRGQAAATVVVVAYSGSWHQKSQSEAQAPDLQTYAESSTFQVRLARSSRRS